MAARPSGSHCVKLFSQNARGLKSEEKLEEATTKLLKGDYFVGAFQETRKTGSGQIESQGVLLIYHGLDEAQQCARGKGGVGLMLSGDARAAWTLAGADVMTFGPRIVAVRLHIKDAKGKLVKLFVVSAYAPIGAAPAAERNAYFDNLERCFAACGSGEVLIVLTDANASMGVRQTRNCKVLGPHGNAYRNEAGRQLVEVLSAHELCAASTFFDKSGRGAQSPEPGGSEDGAPPQRTAPTP